MCRCADVDGLIAIKSKSAKKFKHLVLCRLQTEVKERKESLALICVWSASQWNLHFVRVDRVSPTSPEGLLVSESSEGRWKMFLLKKMFFGEDPF